MADLRLAVRLLLGAGPRELVRLAAMAIGVGFACFAVLVGIAAPRVAADAHAIQVDRAPTYDLEATGGGLQLGVTAATLEDRPWTRVAVSGATPDSPLPPGLSRWPAPGTTIASPALRRLSERDAAVARSLGTLAPGTIGRSGLTGPDELYSYTATVVTSAGAADAGAKKSDSTVVSGFGNPDAVPHQGSILMLGIEVGLLVLTPAVVFLLTALRLSAVSRSRRSFALGLAGMGPTRAAALYGWEMSLVAAVGLALGESAYAAVQGWLGSSGLAGVRWWPEQGRIGIPLLVVVALVMVSAVRYIARRAMHSAASMTRSERGRAAERVLPAAAAVVGLPSVGFLVIVAARGWARPSQAWASDRYAAYIAIAVVGAVVGVVLGVPWLIARLAEALAPRVAPPVALGLRGAAFRLPSSRRLVAFVACAVMLAGLSAAFIASIHRGAVGDPATASISFSVAAVDSDPHWVERLPAGPFTVDAPVDGTAGTYDVVVGDCPAVLRQAETVFNHPGSCTPSFQRGHGGIGGASAQTLRLGGGTITLPQAPDTTNVTWDLKFPVRDAPWLSRVRGGTVTYWVSRSDHSYERTMAALVHAFPDARMDGGLKDPDQYALYEQQAGTVRAAASLGVLLSACAFVLAALEGRWARSRSLAALAALGTPRRALRSANLVEFAFPVITAAIPSALVGLLGGWAVLSFRGTDGMFSSQIWIWTLIGTGVSVVVASTAGWLTGTADFRREALADS